MSELREWTASEIEEYDDARLELAEDGKIDCTRVYIKSEADKAIARNKYNRCLAMAKLCQWKMGVFIYKKEKNEFYYRWHKRWLTLADKYKEGNV